jgi:hypothetical protein
VSYVLFLFLSIFLIASSASAYDGVSKGKITALRLQSNRVLVSQVNAINPANCANASYLSLEQGDQVYLKNMYAALLTAYASGREVELFLTGCRRGYAEISEVWVK